MERHGDITKKRVFILTIAVSFLFSIFGCTQREKTQMSSTLNDRTKNEDEMSDKDASAIFLGEEIVQLTEGLSAIKHEGDYGFDEFLIRGGASSDAEVAAYISENLSISANGISFDKMSFGCSTIAVKDESGNALFGRNFDWNNCNAMIVQNIPSNGYASISTVNIDFINISGIKLSSLPSQTQAIICLYAPLDGMNEKGLAVSANMIQDIDTISQNSDKPDITTTTAIRLILDKAANIDEAIELLKQYDMHASMGYMMHLSLGDASGRSVVVEYINNEMVVNETSVVTNFYFAKGQKNGIGTTQSHKRYDILMQALTDYKTMSMNDVRDALSSVSKKNFGEFESTEWSIVFNQSTGEIHYYHRENYDNKYTFIVK